MADLPTEAEMTPDGRWYDALSDIDKCRLHLRLLERTNANEHMIAFERRHLAALERQRA